MRDRFFAWLRDRVISPLMDARLVPFRVGCEMWMQTNNRAGELSINTDLDAYDMPY